MDPHPKDPEQTLNKQIYISLKRSERSLLCKTKQESSRTPMLFPSVLNRVSTLATSDTKRSLKTRQQPSRIPTNAGLERPSGRKRLLKSSKKLFSLSLAEVGLVLGPGRSWSSTTSLDYTPLAANASITTGASAGTESPRSCHGHHPPRRGKTARAGPARVEAPSATAGPPRRSTRRAHGRRARAGSPRTQRCPEPRQRCRGAQGLQHPAPALLHRASSRPGRPRSPYPPG